MSVCRLYVIIPIIHPFLSVTSLNNERLAYYNHLSFPLDSLVDKPVLIRPDVRYPSNEVFNILGHN